MTRLPLDSANPPSWHVVPRRPGGRNPDWALQRSGSSRARRVYGIRSVAWMQAKALAKAARGRAYLHDTNGRIEVRADFTGDAP